MPAERPDESTRTAFAGTVGIFLALGLLKFGNPMIFQTGAPSDIFEFIYTPWPVNWGYLLLAGLCIWGTFLGKRKAGIPIWLLALPAVWFLWQVIAATQSVEANLTGLTLKHFAACIACFYLGWFALSEAQDLKLFWAGLLCGFGIMVYMGFNQRFGGLEATREFFYQLPDWQELHPDLLTRLASDRIFSTLFYPNTLAAAILLFLPLSLAGVWLSSGRFTMPARFFLVGATGLAALACLYWSGSKAGWLVVLGMSGFALLHLRFSVKLKAGVVAVLIAVGLAAFFVRYADFFDRGATSVVARFDYWRAGLEIVKANPLLGTGPGTFSVLYAKLKPPEAEMARLAHNDYLQQATDSGLPGFLAYFVFVSASLGLLYLRVFLNGNLAERAAWLALFGISIHGLVEFNLYIPAIAWPSFLLFGWLWGRVALLPSQSSQSNGSSESKKAPKMVPPSRAPTAHCSSRTRKN